MDFQEGSVGGHAARTKAILRASTRIAVHLSAALNSHAHEQYRQGHFRNAFRGFGLVLVINPASPTATVLHASSLELAHPRANFMKPARRSTILAPLGADGWKLAMRGSLAAGNLAATREHAERHVLLSPRSRDGWLGLARARFRAGEAGKALPALRQAAVLAPTDLDVHLALSRCLFRLGMFSKALSASDIAAKCGAGGQEFDFERARIARAAGRPDIAEPLLDRLAASDAAYAHKREVLELTAAADDLRASAP